MKPASCGFSRSRGLTSRSSAGSDVSVLNWKLSFTALSSANSDGIHRIVTLTETYEDGYGITQLAVGILWCANTNSNLNKCDLNSVLKAELSLRTTSHVTHVARDKRSMCCT